MTIKRKIAVLAAITISLCTSLTGCGKKSFDVMEKMEIKFNGYNGYGYVELDNEYAWVDDIVEWYGDSISDMEAASIEIKLSSDVEYEISPSEGLSNGDTVTITADISSDVEEYAFELNSKEITATVEGLKEVEEYDPFENVTLTFEGVAPNGTANIKINDNDGSISYKISQNSGLSNGDTITVSAEPNGGMNQYAEKYGKVLSVTEKTYTVEGLSSYASTIDSIPDDMQKKMMKQADDSIRASCAGWEEGNSLKNLEFVGNYFLTAKDGFTPKTYNEIYFVYKVTANVTGLKRGGDGKTKETGEEIYYTFYRYSDIMLLPDETCSVNLSNGNMADNSIESDYGYNSFFSAVFYKFKGYKDLDSMFNDCVTQKIGQYDYETTVK